MSHNKEVEKKIGVVDALIKEMENHRDQAKLFEAAADALRKMNQQLAHLDGQFTELSSEALHERFEALEAQSRKVAEKVEGDSQSLQGKLKAMGSKIDAFEKKLQSSIVQSLEDIQKLDNKTTIIEELSNDTIRQMVELQSATRAAIEDTRTETQTVIKESRDSSCELITTGKDQTIEVLKTENFELKELIAEQSQRSQKWSVILLLVGLCATGVGGVVLYFLLISQQ